MGKISILEETIKNPITFIGKAAGICYGSDVSDNEKNYKRGLNCINSGHDRTLEFPDIYMVIDGYSARTIRQLYTHIGGMPSRLQSSTRYIDYSNFDYVIPPQIERGVCKKNENIFKAEDLYRQTIDVIEDTYLKLINDFGISKEDAGMVLPLSMITKICCKYNARSLCSIFEQRDCSRAYWEIKNLVRDCVSSLNNYSDEWKTFCDIKMKCKCEKVGFCIEKNCCGRMPKFS